ncbi:hypothetical protein GCM10022234_22480 [Aeromicrobium panaciterrae]|uniref:hypothetical protein n=1 Tax=Aeromicrobium panaciterrae TaxID=363861 RepID=UPI0031CF74B9
MQEPSLYDAAEPDDVTVEPKPDPGTAHTAAVETIDNDRADGLNFSAGVVRQQ